MRTENRAKVEFVVGEFNSSGFIAIFEQDDTTGYLYLCESNYKVREALHIYNRSKVTATEDQVKVVWSADGQRCGVLIGSRLRGVIGINGDMYRPPMTSLDSDPVTLPEWTFGFEGWI